MNEVNHFITNIGKELKALSIDLKVIETQN